MRPLTGQIVFNKINKLESTSFIKTINFIKKIQRKDNAYNKKAKNKFEKVKKDKRIENNSFIKTINLTKNIQRKHTFCL